MAAIKRQSGARRRGWTLVIALMLGIIGGRLIARVKILRAGDAARKQLGENLQTRLTSGASVDHLAASVAAGKAAARRRQAELGLDL